MIRYVEKITSKGRDYYYFKCRGFRAKLPKYPGHSEFAKRYDELLARIRPARTRPETGNDAVGYVYFLKIDDKVKIGFSAHPPGRLREVRPSQQAKVQMFAYVPGTMQREKALHERLKPYRRRGEWFTLDAEVLQTIYSMLADAFWHDRTEQE